MSCLRLVTSDKGKSLGGSRGCRGRTLSPVHRGSPFVSRVYVSSHSPVVDTEHGQPCAGGKGTFFVAVQGVGPVVSSSDAGSGTDVRSVGEGRGLPFRFRNPSRESRPESGEHLLQKTGLMGVGGFSPS